MTKQGYEQDSQRFCFPFSFSLPFYALFETRDMSLAQPVSPFVTRLQGSAEPSTLESLSHVTSSASASIAYYGRSRPFYVEYASPDKVLPTTSNHVEWLLASNLVHHFPSSNASLPLVSRDCTMQGASRTIYGPLYTLVYGKAQQYIHA